MPGQVEISMQARDLRRLGHPRYAGHQHRSENAGLADLDVAIHLSHGEASDWCSRLTAGWEGLHRWNGSKSISGLHPQESNYCSRHERFGWGTWNVTCRSWLCDRTAGGLCDRTASLGVAPRTACTVYSAASTYAAQFIGATQTCFTACIWASDAPMPVLRLARCA
jgi:hypothetical protein